MTTDEEFDPVYQRGYYAALRLAVDYLECLDKEEALARLKAARARRRHLAAKPSIETLTA